ncbi:MAG: MFS transporter [Clostridia bacterium]|nr:MFS transporter [Clostridia bacterium]
MKLQNTTKLSYGVGNLGYATIAQTVNNFIMFFGTSVLGISGTLVGLAVALSVFWDGISDPVVGYISDKTNNKRFGKRLGFLIFGTIGMVIFNILLWSVPMDASEGVKFGWLLVCLLLLETCCTTFATPYTALGIDIAPDYAEQSRLQGFKTVFFILGMVLPSVLMMLLMPSGEGQGQFVQSGYINIAYFTSALCLISGLVCVFGTIKKATRIYENKPTKNKPNENLKSNSKTSKNSANKGFLNTFFHIFYTFFLVLKKPNYSHIIIGYSVALISTAFLSSVGMHLFTYAYHFTSMQISLLMTALFIAAIISQAFWINLANRIDKKPALKISMVVVLVGILLTSVTFILRLYIPTSTLFFVVMFTIFICGFGTGALYSLPMSMYADCITLDRIKSGANKSGIYSGFMTLAYNIANCFALLVVGVLLDVIRFDSSQPVQALSVQNSLGFIVFVGCGLSIAIGLWIFSKYNITRSEVLKSKLKHKTEETT